MDKKEMIPMRIPVPCINYRSFRGFVRCNVTASRTIVIKQNTVAAIPQLMWKSMEPAPPDFSHSPQLIAQSKRKNVITPLSIVAAFISTSSVPLTDDIVN